MTTSLPFHQENPAAAPAVRGRQRVSWQRRLLFVGILLALTYALLEVLFTSWILFRGPSGSSQLFEETHQSLYQYDPVIGSRLCREPVRTAIIRPDGVVEASAALRGNNLGLPDASDFLPEKPAGITKRYAVFGGSYIAGLYLQRRFPDRLEERAAEAGERVEFMNCCCEGSGLTNWWLLIQRVLDPQDFALDGVIFTVSADNLYRGLLATHDEFSGGWHTIYVNQVRTLTAEEIPDTFAEVRPLLYRVCLQDSFRSPAVFDAIFASRNDPDYRVPRQVLTPLRPQLFWNLYVHWRDSRVPHSSTQFGKPAQGGHFDAMAAERIADIRRFLEKRRLPAVVIQLPPDSERPSRFSEGITESTLEFANRLGLPFWDGREAYASMSDQEYVANFLQNDPHWNQIGCDFFADATWAYLREHPLSEPLTTPWQIEWNRRGMHAWLSAMTDKADAVRVSLRKNDVPWNWNSWDGRLVRDVQIDSQVKYVCSFAARSKQAQTVVCLLTDPHDPQAQGIMWSECNLTSEWQTWRIEFIAPRTLKPAKLAIQFGEAQGAFDIADFSLEKSDE